MKKAIVLFLFASFFINIHAQNTETDYFLGKRTYCKKPTDERSVKLYNLGLECIRKNLYLGSAVKIFTELIEKDQSFCDAYFLAGYAFRMSNMNDEAVVLYYAADSLAQNRSVEFKQNLATVSMMTGNIQLSRKKFKEMTQFFPDNPEGFYGIALTSLVVEDYENGLENINLAEKKYINENEDCFALKAVLLTFNNHYEESIPYFEKVRNQASKNDVFIACYALSLQQIGTKKSDEALLKKAKKYYKKVKNKQNLPEQLQLNI